MQTSRINNESMDLDIALNLHKQEVNNKELTQTEKKQSRKSSMDKGAKQTGLPTPNQAPAIGNMGFQVCGAIEATLSGLQAVVFKNEFQIMLCGTKQATLSFEAQRKATLNAYQNSLTAARKQEQQMTFQAAQSFTNAGVGVASLGAQMYSENKSANGQEIDALSQKVKANEALSEKLSPSSTQTQPANVQVGDNGVVQVNGQARSSDMNAKIQELCSGNPKDLTENAHDYEDAVQSMTSSEKMQAYKALQEQNKTLKMEMNTY